MPGLRTCRKRVATCGESFAGIRASCESVSAGEGVYIGKRAGGRSLLSATTTGTAAETWAYAMASMVTTACRGRRRTGICPDRQPGCLEHLAAAADRRSTLTTC